MLMFTRQDVATLVIFNKLCESTLLKWLQQHTIQCNKLQAVTKRKYKTTLPTKDQQCPVNVETVVRILTLSCQLSDLNTGVIYSVLHVYTKTRLGFY